MATLTITANPSPAYYGEPFTLTFEFDVVVTGFTQPDVTFQSGSVPTVNSFEADADGRTFRMHCTAPADSSGGTDVTIIVNPNVVDQGNTVVGTIINYELAPLTVEWQDIPTVSVGDRFHARLAFSHAVTGLTVADFRLRRIGGSGHITPTASQISITHEGNNVYLIVVNVTGAFTGSRTYRLRLRRDSVNFANGTGPEGILDSDDISIDTSITPEATLTFDVSEGEGGVPLTARVNFNQPVSGLLASDFTATNGTIGALREINSSSYELEVTPDDGSGTLRLALAVNAVNEGSAAASENIDYASGIGFTLSTDCDGHPRQS